LTAIYVDEDNVEHSLNKNKNWELLNDPDIKQIKKHMDVEGEPYRCGITNKTPSGYGGGNNYHYKQGRNFVTVNDQRKTKYDLVSERNYILLPFESNEYPINRETHTNYSSHCGGCFRSHGRIWQLKGQGDKAKNKTKGMKRERQRELDFLFS
jgi:hypothetical protein